MGNTVFTLQVVGVVSTIIMAGSVIGWPSLKDKVDPETREKLDPIMVSLMTASLIVVPLTWLLVFTISSLRSAATLEEFRESAVNIVTSILSEIEKSDLGSLANLV